MIPLRPSQVVFYAFVVTLTVAITSGLGFSLIRQQMLTGNDFLLDAESKEITARLAQLTPPLDPGKIKSALQEHMEYDEALFFFQVHDLGGTVLFRSSNLGDGTLTDLTGGQDKRTTNDPKFGLMRVAEYYLPNLHIQIAMSLRNFKSINDTFLRVFLLGLPMIAVLSLAFGAALRHSTLRPMRLMQATARRISANNLGERIAVVPGGGEMAALAELLNGMIDRLEKSFNHAKRFTADVSHELMTPLSIIRLHAERLLNAPELPAKYHQSVEEMMQETIHLADIIERLLMLARADASALSLKLSSVSTRAFVANFVEDAQALAESRGLKVSLGTNDQGLVTMDQGLVRQVLFNLFSNALRFSPPGGTITFHSKCGAGQWTVEVLDEGEGVPPGRLNEIFGRFVQIKPRSEPGGGSGLGLAICKSIIELLKGQIWAQNRTDRKGLLVAFSLPLDRENS